MSGVPRDERRISLTPTEIPPHLEKGNLPPCEVGGSTDRPCPRPAVWHYNYIYYCNEHLKWAQAGEDEDDASTAIYHTKRFLWKAQVEGIERLEYYSGLALVEFENDLKKAKEAAEEASKKAWEPVV